MGWFRRIYVIILSLLLFTLGGCAYQSNYNAMKICGSYAVPGMFCFDLKGIEAEAEEIERDSQGRVLFSYKTESDITGERETAMVIYQTFNKDYVYFYEDECYLFGTPDEDAIEQLKKRNDWQEDLNYSKMSKRPIKVSFDQFIISNAGIDSESLRATCARLLGIETKQINTLCLLDVNSNNVELLWLVIDKNGVTEQYYVLAKSAHEVYTMKGDNNLPDAATIAKFKRDNGWYDNI